MIILNVAATSVCIRVNGFYLLMDYTILCNIKYFEMFSDLTISHFIFVKLTYLINPIRKNPSFNATTPNIKNIKVTAINKT